MPSFDTVSEVDVVELKNAVDNAKREITTRFDFRGKLADFEQKDLIVTISSESDFQVQQLVEILVNNLAKRNIDVKSLKLSDDIVHRGKTFTQTATFQQGIDQPTAKKIVKLIKDKKLKVQSAIQGDKVRVTGKKRDDLQSAMAAMREAEFDMPLQFDNFRD